MLVTLKYCLSKEALIDSKKYSRGIARSPWLQIVMLDAPSWLKPQGYR